MTAIGSWPVDDRLRLMEEIWDQLADEGYAAEWKGGRNQER